MCNYISSFQFGARDGIRLGPHTMAQIKRGGYASTYARDEVAKGLIV